MFKSALFRPCPIFSVRSTKSSASNHYDVLKLRNDCSHKDIRESFIKLSKMHHPDSSKSPSSAANFQSIMEAYKVLGKPETRRTYDMDMRVRPVFHPTSGFGTTSDFSEMHPNAAASASRDYYGIKGVRKLSNRRIYFAILCFAGIGVLLQAIAIKCSFVFKREQLDQASMRAHKVHTEIRSEVVKNDRQEQLERVLKNMQKTL